MKFDHQKGRYVAVNGASLYIEETGSKDAVAVILLHGGLGNLTEYNGLLASLPKDYRYIGVDFRGHGLSELGSSPLSYQVYQEDIEELCHQLKLKEYIIVGFSDGGITGLRLSVFNPNKVLGLVAVGAHGQITKQTPGYQIFSQMNEKLWREYFPEQVEEYEKSNPAPCFTRLSTAVFSMWSYLDPDNYPQTAIEGIECPVLLVRGEEDHLYTSADLRADSSLIDNCQRVELAGAEHDVHVQSSSELAKEIETFFLSLEQNIK
ncbi:alpha/beta fold hydrolase [Vibrio sonorensis]|uniref:alpha/beta fold hydrolase n=1 Tax=Vibrio sonorensis TaxID=1004316 RepID=UPI0008D8ED0E|nr:alpha/beta hydrolase [Vibrio sonorensis]